MSHKPHYTQHVEEHVDQWHHHSSEEGAPQEEHASKPNIPVLLGAFVGSVAFVGATILATYLYFGVHMRSLRAKRMENTALAADFLKYRGDTNKKLADGNMWWNDDNARAGLVSIPLDKARERVIARYAGDEKK